MFGLDQRPSVVLPQASDGESEPPLFRSDEFRIFCMKVLPCSKRYCHDWTTCPFSHPSEKARRRDPRLFNYTGIACPDMKKDNTCVRGDQCPYAHNVFEYWLHPTRYRTQLCNDGLGCRRRVCFFAHTLQELRVPSSKPFVNPETLAAVTAAAAATEAAKAEDALKLQQAGAMGAVRKDAALAALSSQLAGMQLQAGPGRRASMPEPLGGNAGGQTDPAVVQVLQALLRQAAVQHRQGQSLPPSQRGSGVSGDAFRRATSADYASTVQQMPVAASRELPSTDQLQELYASIESQQQARWQQQYVVQQQQQSNGRHAQAQHQGLDSCAPQSYDDAAAQQVLLDQGSWRQQSMPPLLQSVAGFGSSTQASPAHLQGTPRGSLELGEAMRSGAGVRGGDSSVAGMPAYTLDYAGNCRPNPHVQYHMQVEGGSPSFAHAASPHERRSADYPRQESLYSHMSVQESRRVSADEVRRASLEVGAGMHNATYQQVYQQAYQSIRVPPQQLYQASSLYATSGGGGNGGEMGAGSQAAGTDQASATPAFNVDTFGENLMSSNRSLFQAASHSDHSSPDSARRLSDAAAPFGTAPAEPQLQQQGPPHSRSGSLPPLPERSGSAEAGGMAAFAGYSALAEGNGGLSAPLSSFGAAPPISGSSTVADSHQHTVSPALHGTPQPLSSTPE